MRDSVFKGIARLIADAMSLYLVPACVALLPWRCGFFLLKRLAHCSWFYRESVDAQWAGAAAFFPEADMRLWKYRARLLRLVEHVDAYLILLRGQRWLRAQVKVSGDFPDRAQANLLLTYHWGAGNWIWRALKTHGIDAYFLARYPQGRSLGLTRFSQWYGRFRAWGLRRSGSLGVLFTGNSAAAIRTAIADGAGLVGMLDLRAGPEQRTLEFPLLGKSARFPFGLVRIAEETRTRVTLFSVGLDWNTGRRDLQIQVLPLDASAEQIMGFYVRHLDARLQAMPEAWNMWREARTIFVEPAS